MKLIIKNGTRYYPIGKRSKYQHVFYNYVDICYNHAHDNEDSDDAYEKYEEAERILNAFESGPQNAEGIVFVTYEDYKKMKDIIGAYIYRHNGL